MRFRSVRGPLKSPRSNVFADFLDLTSIDLQNLISVDLGEPRGRVIWYILPAVPEAIEKGDRPDFNQLRYGKTERATWQIKTW